LLGMDNSALIEVDHYYPVGQGEHFRDCCRPGQEGGA
jgi:hypothetical protein